MLTYIDGSGNLVKTIPEKVFQGSNYANTFYFIGAYPQSSVVQIAFKLPQTGHYTAPYLMLNANIPTELGLNAWSFDVPIAITEYHGKIEFQVKVLGGQKQVYINGDLTNVSQTIASAYGTFEVEKGIPVVLPETPSQTIYDQILDLISQIQAKINNHELVGMGILPWNNTFDYPLNTLIYYGNNLYKCKNVDENGHCISKNPTTETEYWEEWDLDAITSLQERVGTLETTVSGFDGRITQAEADATEAKTKANSALTKVGRINVQDNNDGTFTFTNGENQQTTIQSGYRPDETTIQLDANNKLEAIAIKDSTSTITPSDVRSNTSAISTIESKIPAQASSSNQLADKQFVNSSIATNTANFIGTFENVQQLKSIGVLTSGTVLKSGSVIKKHSIINNYTYTSDDTLSVDLVVFSGGTLAFESIIKSGSVLETGCYINHQYYNAQTTISDDIEIENITNNDYANVINQELDFANTTELNAYDKDLLTNYDYAWVVNGNKYDLYRFDIVTQTWESRATSIHKADVLLIIAYNRYTYNGSTEEWSWNYTVNTSGFTAVQWEAINSGITSAKVAEIDEKVNKQVTSLTSQTDIDFQVDRFDVKFKYQDTSGTLPVTVTDIVGFDENGLHHTKNGTTTRPKVNNNDIAYLSDIPNVSNFAQRKITAPDYDNTATYSVGDVVIYNQTLYKCATAVSTAEDFDSTKWTATDVIEYVDSKGVTKEQIIANLPPFKSTIQVYILDATITYTFPISSSTNFGVDWGDGTFNYYTTAQTSLTHTFASTGYKYINFYGNWQGILFTNNPGSTKAVLRTVFYDSNITSIPSFAFYNCTNLTDFQCVHRITISNSAFSSCTSLRTFPWDKVKSVSNAFANSTYLTGKANIILSYNMVIGGNSFRNTSISEIEVYGDSSSENAPRIQDSAFGSAFSLRKLTLTGLRSLGTNILVNDSRLETLVINKGFTNTVVSLAGTLDENNQLPSGFVILVPYSQLQAYKTATNWTTYANKIYPIGGQYSETVTIADTDWTLNSTTNLYEATATVIGATNESRNILDWSLVDSNGVQIEDTYGLSASAQGSMSITFTAETVPTSSIYISVQSTLTNYQE